MLSSFGSFGSSGSSDKGTNLLGTQQINNSVASPSYNSIYPDGTPNIFKGNNKKQNNGQNNGQKKNNGQNNGQKKNNGQNNNQEEQSNFSSNEGVFSIPIIKEFSDLNTKNIEIAEQEGMIGCSIC